MWSRASKTRVKARESASASEEPRLSAPSLPRSTLLVSLPTLHTFPGAGPGPTLADGLSAVPSPVQLEVKGRGRRGRRADR